MQQAHDLWYAKAQLKDELEKIESVKKSLPDS
jgi:hypothetical protein